MATRYVPRDHREHAARGDMAFLSPSVLAAPPPAGAAFVPRNNLLDIPTELRLMIYGFILADWNFAREYAANEGRVTSPALRLQFLMTCKLIYEEAKVVAYSTICFVFPIATLNDNSPRSERQEENKQVVAQLSSLRHVSTLKSIGFRYYDMALHFGSCQLTTLQKLSVFRSLEKVYLLDDKLFRPHIVNLINTVFTLIEVYPALKEIYFIGMGISLAYDRIVPWDKFRTMFDNRLLLPNGKYRRAFYDEWEGRKKKKKMYKWPGSCTKKFGDGTEANFVVMGRIIKLFAWSLSEVEHNLS